MHQTGEEDGVRWYVTLLGGKTFEIGVTGEKSTSVRKYQTSYPINFGLDVYDQGKINEILDEMIHQMKEEIKEQEARRQMIREMTERVCDENDEMLRSRTMDDDYEPDRGG